MSHSLPVVRWRLTSDNLTSNLIGRGWLNTSSEFDPQHSLALRVEFPDSTSEGTFQTGMDEDQLSNLFQFSFTQVKNSQPLAVGEWSGEVKATYVFQAATSDRFTIIVTPRNFNLNEATKAAASSASKASKKSTPTDDDDDFTPSGPASTGHPLLTAEELANAESYIYVGHRVKVEVEKTLFQKYGTVR